MRMTWDTGDHCAELRGPGTCHLSLAPIPDHVSAPHPDTQASGTQERLPDVRAWSHKTGLVPNMTSPTHPPRIQQRCWRCGMTRAQEKDHATSSHGTLLAPRPPGPSRAGPSTITRASWSLACCALVSLVQPQAQDTGEPSTPPWFPRAPLRDHHRLPAPCTCPVLTLQTARAARPWRCGQLDDGARGHCCLPQSPRVALGSDPRDGTGRGRWDTPEWTRPVHQAPDAGVSRPCGQGQHFLKHSSLAR